MPATGDTMGEKGGGGPAMVRRAALTTSSAPDKEKAAVAKAWLAAVAARLPDHGGSFDGFALRGIRLERAGGGTVVCCFRVPAHLTDADGSWAPGAITTLIDNIGVASVVAATGELKVSVALDISHFAPVKVEEEVELEGKVLYHAGTMTSVTVDVRKKISGDPVACGCLWMVSKHIPKL